VKLDVRLSIRGVLVPLQSPVKATVMYNSPTGSFWLSCTKLYKTLCTYWQHGSISGVFMRLLEEVTFERYHLPGQSWFAVAWLDEVLFCTGLLRELFTWE
jgi:hypothetical protein